MVAPSDIEGVFALNFDDEGHAWFGCWLKDGRTVNICYELDEVDVLEEA